MSKSVYSGKVLEMVAKEIGGYFTGEKIVRILTEFGIARENVQYPNTKWWTINEAFKFIKATYEKPDDVISRLISEFLHPLNHNAEKSVTDRLAKAIEKYIIHDNFYIQETQKEYLIFSDEEMEEIHGPPPEAIKQDKADKASDDETIKQNKDVIKKLRDNHQAYIDVIEIFCQNSKKPTKELNDAYLFLSKKIETTIAQLELHHYRINFYKPFKTNLYSAEIEWNGSGAELIDLRLTPKLSWDAVRPSLYEVHSQITEVLNIAEGDTEMSDDEKRLEEIMGLISEKRTQKTVAKPQREPMRIEIAKMPDINIKTTHGKNKAERNTVPMKIPAGTKWENIMLQFSTNENATIHCSGRTHATGYADMGFDDKRNGKPNLQWAFLLVLAKNNGVLLASSPEAKDKFKKQKQLLSERLQEYFSMDTDPFEAYKGGYRIKMKLIHPTPKATISPTSMIEESEVEEIFRELTS